MLLARQVNGLAIYERLQQAFRAPTSDAETGIVYTTPEQRAVGFIFCDSIYMTGQLLMASLQRRRAALHMASLAQLMGRVADARYYRQQAEPGRSPHRARICRCAAIRWLAPRLYGHLLSTG